MFSSNSAQYKKIYQKERNLITMKYTIIHETYDVCACSTCGSFPRMVAPYADYSDRYMECTGCKKTTINTGGYRYAEEIEPHIAEENAIKEWNRMNK